MIASRPALRAAIALGACLAAGVDPAAAQSCDRWVAPGADGRGDGLSEASAWTVAQANARLVAGQTACLLEGPPDYGDRIEPVSSGTELARIVYRNAPGEAPTFRSDPQGSCGKLAGVSFVTVAGITCDGRGDAHDPPFSDDLELSGGIFIISGTHNVVEGSTFRWLRGAAVWIGASTSIGWPSRYNVVRNNTVEHLGWAVPEGGGTGDAIVIAQGSSENLVEGNTISYATHNALELSTSASSNVIRNNDVRNPWWRVLALTGPGDETGDFNLIEGNRFHLGATDTPFGNLPFDAVRVTSHHTIVRRNMIHDNAPWALHTGTQPKWLRGDHNHVYHNVIVDNESVGVKLIDKQGSPSPVPEPIDHNVFLNNVIAGNSSRDPGDEVQISADLLSLDLRSNQFFANHILNVAPGEGVIAVDGLPETTLAQHEWSHAGNFGGNLEDDPAFVDRAGKDFALAPASELIDRGAFLTVTTAACSGTSLELEDAGFFMRRIEDQGVVIHDGDLIQLEGQQARLRVIDVDAERHRLTVDRPATCAAGDGVSLAYAGSAPDVGLGVTQATFVSIATEDGWVLEKTERTRKGGSSDASSASDDALRLGDAKGDRQYRSILSFDTSGIPAGARITQVTLALTRGSTSGTDPFVGAAFGEARIDVRTGSFGGDPALHKSDFEAVADGVDVARLTSPAGAGALSSVDLTAAAAYLNDAGRTQLRLSFEVDDDDDHAPDFAGFHSGDAPRSEDRPRLVVRYEE